MRILSSSVNLLRGLSIITCTSDDASIGSQHQVLPAVWLLLINWALYWQELESSTMDWIVIAFKLPKQLILKLERIIPTWSSKSYMPFYSTDIQLDSHCFMKVFNRRHHLTPALLKSDSLPSRHHFQQLRHSLYLSLSSIAVD